MSEEGSAIFKQYINYHNEAVLKYGELSVVFMMVGSFYECYAVNDNDKNTGPNLHELSDILNIIVTKKNKAKVHNINNPYMLGFPDHSINKFKKVLLNEGYTITIVDQITPSPNPRRAITEICSPGTVIQDFARDVDNYLASIYIDCGEINDKKIHVAGISLINVQTGKNIIHHVITPINEEHFWINELNSERLVSNILTPSAITSKTFHSPVFLFLRNLKSRLLTCPLLSRILTGILTIFLPLKLLMSSIVIVC